MTTITLISLILLGISLLYFLKQPKEINYIYGYRTKRSMKSLDNWIYSNRKASIGFLFFSGLNLVLSLIFANITISVFLVLFTIEISFLVYWIEKKLKMNTDES